MKYVGKCLISRGPCSKFWIKQRVSSSSFLQVRKWGLGKWKWLAIQEMVESRLNPILHSLIQMKKLPTLSQNSVYNNLKAYTWFRWSRTWDAFHRTQFWSICYSVKHSEVQSKSEMGSGFFWLLAEPSSLIAHLPICYLFNWWELNVFNKQCSKPYGFCSQQNRHLWSSLKADNNM